MIARINRLTARYEGDVRKAEGESRRSRDELEEAKSIFQASERSLQEQMDSVKEECGLLLKNKDAELAAVRGELKALQDTKATMEESARNEAWESVNGFLSGRIKAVKERLELLRGEATMDFVNFMQAKNNLEFLREVDRNPGLTVGTERARLKAEMARYSNSEARFDQVVDEIEAELNFLPPSPEPTVSLDLEGAVEAQTGAVGTELTRTPELVEPTAEAGAQVEANPVVEPSPAVSVPVERTPAPVEQARVPTGVEVNEAEPGEVPVSENPAESGGREDVA